MATKPGVNTVRSASRGPATVRAFSVCLVLAFSGLLGQTAIAQDWQVDPFIELIATYTDNLYLFPEGLESPSYVGQVNPGISIVKDGGRFTTDTNYRMQVLFFSEDSDLNAIFHQLDADASLEVISESFFIDMDASIGQSVVDPRRPIPTSNVITTQNLGNVTFANINPYLVQQIGSSAAYVRADYIRGIGRYEDFEADSFSSVDNFTQTVWGFYLGTNEEETGFEWSLIYDYQFIDFEVTQDYKFERAGGAIGIPITRSFRVIALGGAESDFLKGRDVGGLDSEYWEVGFRVNGGQGNVFELRTGRRFFGTSYFGNLEYTGRRFSASMMYSENPRTSAMDGPGSDVSIFSVRGADPTFDDPPLADEVILVPIRTEPYISRMARARLEFNAGRSMLFLAYLDEEREFIDTGSELFGLTDGQRVLTAGYRYELGPRTELELNALMGRYDFAESGVITDIRQIVVGITRQLGSETSMRISVRRAEQVTDRDDEFGNYTENAIDLGLVKRF